ncbi:MAG TPA: hypothetical protein DEP65_05075 [Ruminococcus sp.]|nr:hypothetical protein [Ruminococcus sp.]
MRGPGGKGFIVREVLLLIAALALIVFMCRLWPLLLLMIIGLFVLMIVLLLRATAEPKPVEPKPIPVTTKEPARIPTQNDVFALAYSVILRRVTELVHEKYPQARWIWESPNARSLIENGDDVYILLNSAGGYNRANVTIVNLQVTDIVFGTPEKDDVTDDADADDLDDTDEELPENYELIAFEWVEAHIMNLNARCNEALGEGNDTVLITADELPAKGSWIDVCKQLQKNEIENLECVPEGIQIKLTQ